MYHLVNCRDNTEFPKVILRQEGNGSVSYYFRNHDCVYQSTLIFKSYFKPESALYLYEPRAEHMEPVQSNLKTIATCSPDMCRYKEFCKHGAIKFYMPACLLEELKVVGAHVASNCTADLKDFYAPEEIEKRFERFGEIMRYVIPTGRLALVGAEKLQKEILKTNPFCCLHRL